MSDEQKQSTAPNFNELEQHILRFWEDNKIFEKSLEQTKGKEPYVFYDGPPFATGLPHYGHILGSTVKDLFGRYQTMQGKYVRRRWGWDCHGLPIENIVEKNLNISGKKQIEAIGVERFNKVCRENVLKFVEEWGKMVRRMGRWVDFEQSYKTMDTGYMESVWWALKQMWDKGLIYEDRKVLLYCSRCETPISNFEVAMDNSYRDITEESVYVKFKLPKGQRIQSDLTNDKTFALAWTTTPWTLPGNTSLNVGPDIDYVLIEHENGDRYILAKERLSVVAGNYEIVMEVPARSLEGLEYEPLYPGVIPNTRNNAEFNAEQRGKIERNNAEFETEKYGKFVGDPSRSNRFYLADFVTTTDGTGIVHNAAMYGEEDYQLAKEKNIPRMDMLDHKGQYLPVAPEHLRGVFFQDANKIVLEDLRGNGLLYKTEHYLHSYPHCWRCGTPLFYNALPSWFVNIQSIKPRLRELNQEQIAWYPGHLKMGRFDKSMEGAPDWNISRNRYWATPLPFWKCSSEDCGNVTCIGSVGELIEKSLNIAEVYPVLESGIRNKEYENRNNPNSKVIIPNSLLEQIDLHKPYIDQVILKCDKCGNSMHRIPEVVDCWVESGSMPFAELHYPFENNSEGHGGQTQNITESFQHRFPADFVAEYIAQTRTWFYVMHVLSAILFDRAPFKNVVTTGTVLAEDGSKMSKSKNNYPDPYLLIEKYGIDAIRFYLMSNPVMNAEDLNFSEKGVQEVNRKLSLLLYNCWSFYRMYSTDKMAAGDFPAGEQKQILDKWVLAKLSEVGLAVTKYLDSYDTVRASRLLLEFVSDLSTWYVRRSRERIKEGGRPGQEALATLGFVLAETAKLLAPYMPFLADYIYRDATGEDSVHLASWPVFKAPDTEVLKGMETVRQLVEAGLALRKDNALKVRQPLAEVEYYLKDAVLLGAELEAVLAEELNVKKVTGLAQQQFRSGSATRETESYKLALDLQLTDELKSEGLAREIERQVQDLRKKSNLKVGELVDVFYNTQSHALEEALLKRFDRKKTFVSQISKSLEVEADFETQAEVEGQALWIGLVKM